MALWTMTAGATFHEYGFVTPVYFIAALLVGVDVASRPLAAVTVRGDPF